MIKQKINFNHNNMLHLHNHISDNNKSAYSVQDYMLMINKSCIYKHVSFEGEYYKPFIFLREIENDFRDVNMFALGYIAGKRAERKRRKAIH